MRELGFLILLSRAEHVGHRHMELSAAAVVRPPRCQRVGCSAQLRSAQFNRPSILHGRATSAAKGRLTESSIHLNEGVFHDFSASAKCGFRASWPSDTRTPGVSNHSSAVHVVQRACPPETICGWQDAQHRRRRAVKILPMGRACGKSRELRAESKELLTLRSLLQARLQSTS
jgi:hypothetical protein